MTTTLYDLDAPDELAELDLRDAEPKELAKIVYNAWRSVAEDIDSTNVKEHYIYGQARRITKPYADRLAGMLMEKKQPFKISDDQKVYSGYFLSAIINQSGRKEIACKLETKLSCLASYLPADKTFINYGKAGDWMGNQAEGLVINCGEAGDRMGYGAKCAVVNCGEAGDWMADDSNCLAINCNEAGKKMGWNAKAATRKSAKAGMWMGTSADGIIIALKNPKSFSVFTDAKLVLKEDKCEKMPELGEYFDGLKIILDEGRKDCRALARLPSGWKVRDDVEEILKARGYLK